jgi:fucose permease
MTNDYKNLGRATLCSLAFFGLFVALNSTQNIQTQMLEDDGFGKLGLYSNAFIYLGVGIGSLISTFVIQRIGEIRGMVLGSFLCVPFMATFLLPSIKIEYYQESDIYLL